MAHTKHGKRSLNDPEALSDSIDSSLRKSFPLTFEKQYRDVLIFTYDDINMLLKPGVLHLNSRPLFIVIVYANASTVTLPFVNILFSHSPLLIHYLSSPFCAYSHSFPHLQVVFVCL